MIEPLDDNNLVRIYPNPANDIINIKSDELISNIRIYNFKGEELQTLTTQNKELSLSISNLPDGLFFVKADLVNGTSWTGKFIKKVN